MEIWRIVFFAFWLILNLSVPVENVTIKYLNQTDFVEGRREKFDCVAVGSKPAASIWWFLTYQNGSEIRILDPVRNETTQNKKVFQTVSTLELVLNREYRNIMCQARIENTRWKKSPSVPLEIKYPPEITVIFGATALHQRAYLRCEVQANPTKFVFKIVQKWGNTIKREIDKDSVEFPSFSLEDFGTWVCRVSNGVPRKDYYAEQSVELHMPVRPLIKGKTTEIAMFGERKSLKLCFHCYPEATDVKWFKNGELISSPKYSEEPADDGIFPFSGNCSVLEVNTREKKTVHNFSLVVTNSVGQSSFSVLLLIGQY
ncbi:unnamed protein product [Acanthosepion pharaonis]|uniref:Ig-like domain-containing protein n=1 Tax=Acanthosepion pharaonis TaxID=158019 RepID=A0A812CA12_ACAPH|nr:unnamed protein product [Sepia pharaonis]